MDVLEGGGLLMLTSHLARELPRLALDLAHHGTNGFLCYVPRTLTGNIPTPFPDAKAHVCASVPEAKTLSGSNKNRAYPAHIREGIARNGIRGCHPGKYLQRYGP